jgi:C4-type Zn-finger protein
MNTVDIDIESRINIDVDVVCGVCGEDIDATVADGELLHEIVVTVAGPCAECARRQKEVEE